MSKKRKSKASMKSKEYWDVDNWLWEGLDSDDELLIAYNRRPSEEMTSMCALCYQWFKSSDEFHNHMVTHIDTSRFHECSICQKKFLARFLRMRHESIHRYESNRPFAAYWATQHTDFPSDYFVKNHPMKRFKPIPYTPHYLKDLRRLQKRNEAEPISCIDCEGIFQDFDELQHHYDVHHAIQECVHCPQVLDNFEMYEAHLKHEHDIELPMNYPGGRWKILDDISKAIRDERDLNVANLKFFHNYACSSEYQPSPSRSSLSSGRPRAVYARNSNSILKRSFVRTTKSADKLTSSSSNDVQLDLDSLMDVKENKHIDNGSSRYKNRIQNRNRISAQQTDNESPILDSNPDEESLSMDIDNYDDDMYDEDEEELYIPEIKLEEKYWAGENGGDMPLLLPVSDEIEWIDSPKLEETSFPCQVCGRVFSDEKTRNRHRRLHNVPGDKPFECKFCRKAFATHSNRKEHERIHTGERPYKCPVCERRFIQISNLKKHIQTHKDLNNLQCTTCGKQFVKESSLILHQRSHATERKFKCNICDRAYNYASLLKRHMRIHTGECPYQCPDCRMPFHELVSLHYHRKKMHTGERPHKCSICGRGFILSSDLKKHHRVHFKVSDKEKLLSNGEIDNKSMTSSSGCGTGTDSGSSPIKSRNYVKILPKSELSDSNRIKLENPTGQRRSCLDLDDLAEMDELDGMGDDGDEDSYLKVEDLNPEITLIVQNDGNIDEDGSFHYEIRDLESLTKATQEQNKAKNLQNRNSDTKNPNICSVEFEAIDVNDSNELTILSINEVSGDEEMQQILQTNNNNNSQNQSQTQKNKAQAQGGNSNSKSELANSSSNAALIKLPIPASISTNNSASFTSAKSAHSFTPTTNTVTKSPGAKAPVPNSSVAKVPLPNLVPKPRVVDVVSNKAAGLKVADGKNPTAVVKSPTSKVVTMSMAVKSPSSNVVTMSMAVKSPSSNVVTMSTAVKSPASNVGTKSTAAKSPTRNIITKSTPVKNISNLRVPNVSPGKPPTNALAANKSNKSPLTYAGVGRASTSAKATAINNSTIANIISSLPAVTVTAVAKPAAGGLGLTSASKAPSPIVKGLTIVKGPVPLGMVAKSPVPVTAVRASPVAKAPALRAAAEGTGKVPTGGAVAKSPVSVCSTTSKGVFIKVPAKAAVVATLTGSKGTMSNVNNGSVRTSLANNSVSALPKNVVPAKPSASVNNVARSNSTVTVSPSLTVTAKDKIPAVTVNGNGNGGPVLAKAAAHLNSKSLGTKAASKSILINTPPIISKPNSPATTIPKNNKTPVPTTPTPTTPAQSLASATTTPTTQSSASATATTTPTQSSKPASATTTPVFPAPRLSTRIAIRKQIQIEKNAKQKEQEELEEERDRQKRLNRAIKAKLAKEEKLKMEKSLQMMVETTPTHSPPKNSKPSRARSKSKSNAVSSNFTPPATATATATVTAGVAGAGAGTVAVARKSVKKNENTKNHNNNLELGPDTTAEDDSLVMDTS